jgi:hypothetical protein
MHDKEVQESLLKSVDTGNAMVKTFVGSALSVGKCGSFYGPIKRSNIKTCSDTNKKTKLKCRSGETVQGDFNPELIFRVSVLSNEGRVKDGHTSRSS